MAAGKEPHVLKSLRTSAHGMSLQVVQINTLANNLANVDATGFKQLLTRIAERGAAPEPKPAANGPNPAEVVNPAGEAGAPGAAQTVAAPAAGAAAAAGGRADGPAAPGRAAAAPRAVALEIGTGLDARPGPLRETGRAADLALQGDGFFVVQTERGEFYTRNGHFTLDSNGRLVTGGGGTVQSSGGPLEIEGGAFVVEPDGSVTSGGNLLGRLQVVTFADPARLEHRGDALLAAPRDMAAEPLPAEQVQVVQGQLESSNVNPIDALVDMIAAQRAFEIESRVMQATDENLEKSVNQLPSVR